MCPLCLSVCPSSVRARVRGWLSDQTVATDGGRVIMPVPACTMHYALHSPSLDADGIPVVTQEGSIYQNMWYVGASVTPPPFEI